MTAKIANLLDSHPVLPMMIVLLITGLLAWPLIIGGNALLTALAVDGNIFWPLAGGFLFGALSFFAWRSGEYTKAIRALPVALVCFSALVGSAVLTWVLVAVGFYVILRFRY
jgi:hypothetical protein